MHFHSCPQHFWVMTHHITHYSTIYIVMNNSQRWRKKNLLPDGTYTFFLLLRDVDVHMLLNIEHYLFLQSWIRFFQRAPRIFSSKAHLWGYKTLRQIINPTSCRIKETAAQSTNVQELLVFEQSNMSVRTYAGETAEIRLIRQIRKQHKHAYRQNHLQFDENGDRNRRPVTYSRLMKTYVSSQDFPSARPCI